MSFQIRVVSSPDLIQHVHHFQYNAWENTHAILKAIRAGVGFGSGTKTKIKGNWLELITAEGKG